MALMCYAAGAEGLCFWDTNARDPFKNEWSMVRRLGHRDQLPEWNNGESGFFRAVPLYSVGGCIWIGIPYSGPTDKMLKPDHFLVQLQGNLRYKAGKAN